MIIRRCFRCVAGLVGEWNKITWLHKWTFEAQKVSDFKCQEHETDAVGRGDRILEVNGKRPQGSGRREKLLSLLRGEEIINEIRANETLELTVLKY